MRVDDDGVGDGGGGDAGDAGDAGDDGDSLKWVMI